MDDNATSRRILTTIAAGWGMSARAAASGEEALEWLLDGENFDAAILDMQMPGMDGGALAREIRNQRARLPLVLLSSLGRPRFRLGAGPCSPPISPSFREAVAALRRAGVELLPRRRARSGRVRQPASDFAAELARRASACCSPRTTR